MNLSRAVRIAAALLLLTAATALVPAQQPINNLKPTVILVSMDGFRYDYVDKFAPPTISRLAKVGVRAKSMIPSFPTKTFPNHYTVATGLYPQNHGLVENNVYDFGTVFTMSKFDEVTNPRWWWGEPIWVTAEKQGQHSASYFFVGTGTEIADRLPSYWRHYNGRVPPEMRVDKLLSWLDQPVTERPTMLTLYFSDTDDVGHEFGPDAEETKYAAWNVDRYIERLMNGLHARKVDKKVNVILVSDHGMAAVDQRNAIVMDEFFDIDDKKIADPILTTGEIWQIFPRAGKEDYIIDRLKSIQHATCWRKKDIPARLHYNEGKRIAPIVCSSDEGWFMTTKRRYDEQKKSPDFAQTRGAHGYDNRYQSMGATFIAYGPAFKKGFVAEPFSNVEVYNVMCKILGLTPAKNDGDLDRVKKMLR
ncbi:MAG: ectonucleotide pyrophosphatase/phosphodiesterase [Pyrinomonadaceae bacterium]